MGARGRLTAAPPPRCKLTVLKVDVVVLAKRGARVGEVIRGEASAMQCDRTYLARGHPRPTPNSYRSALAIKHRRNPHLRAPASRDPEPEGSWTTEP